jgi:3-deoxy-manno-octulosonate cytidylyltransferase (CMP-KDO synthetase)
MSPYKILGVIPSRYASTRLPGKPLLDICGKPMVEHVFRRAVASGVFFRIVIATDDERIYGAAEKFGGDVVMTSNAHLDGTSRAAEVAEAIDADYVVNIQGDEPLLDPRMLKELADGIVSDRDADSATISVPITSDEEINDPNVVKVVTDLRGRALYFSRYPVPYRRNKTSCPVQGHLGIYAFSKKFLMQYAQLPPTPLMEAESLEQLRILEHGYSMAVIQTRYPPIGPNVNTEKDLIKVREILTVEKRRHKAE